MRSKTTARSVSFRVFKETSIALHFLCFGFFICSFIILVLSLQCNESGKCFKKGNLEFFTQSKGLCKRGHIVAHDVSWARKRAGHKMNVVFPCCVNWETFLADTKCF